MMRFNHSVVVRNVLIVLSDAARQDKFRGFKVNPDSIKQVSIPTDGAESTKKVNFTKKLLNVYTNSSENGLFLIVFRICLIQQLISVSDIFPGFCFCRCCCSTKQNPTFKNCYRESDTLLFLRTKPIRVNVFGHKSKLCSESSVSTRISVNVV